MIAGVPEAQFFSPVCTEGSEIDNSTLGIWLAASNNPSLSESIQGADNVQLLELNCDLLSAIPLLTTPPSCSLISHVTD